MKSSNLGVEKSMGNKFIEQFDKVKDVVGDFLRGIQTSDEPVVLYGAGYCLNMFLDLLEESNIQIVGIVDCDKNKWGDKVRSIEIISWKQVRTMYPNLQVVITTSHFNEIETGLKDDGFKGQIHHLPINAYYKNSVYGRAFLEKYEGRFQKVYEQFVDDVSREVFINILKHNMSFDDQYFEKIRKYEIQGYFGTGLFKNVEDEIIVDGGAFDGDTIREFFSVSDRRCKRIYAFEPDPVNYEKLSSEMESDKVIPINAGLGRHKAVVNFIMGGGIISRIDKEGKVQIRIDTIDNVLKGERPTFIKMDIEGAEAEALLGGKDLIRECMPMLAISAYHKMRDMFELIELIDELGEGNYEFYLRHTFYYQKIKVQPDVIIYAKRKNG